MKSYLPIAILISVALLATACQPAAEQPDPVAEAAKQAEDVAAIKQVFDDYIVAGNAGDAAAIAVCFTDDAILMPPNAPAVVGREAIQSSFQTGFERRPTSKFTVKTTLEVLEVEVAGDWAFIRAAGTFTRTPKAGGEPIRDTNTNKGLNIFKRQPDGAWKIHRLIYNSDLPLPGAGE